jgi:hypothetical protein
MRLALLELGLATPAPRIAPAEPSQEPGDRSDESTAVVLDRRSRLRDLAGKLRFGRWRWRSA